MTFSFPYMKTDLISGFATVTVQSCSCTSLPQLLLRSGLFPTAPSQPRLAISVDLLGFYRSLFERLCDSINALASALTTHYERRGFRMTTQEVSAMSITFCTRLQAWHVGWCHSRTVSS